MKPLDPQGTVTIATTSALPATETTVGLNDAKLLLRTIRFERSLIAETVSDNHPPDNGTNDALSHDWPGSLEPTGEGARVPERIRQTDRVANLRPLFAAIYDGDDLESELRAGLLTEDELSQLVESAIEHNNGRALIALLRGGADPNGTSRSWRRSYKAPDRSHLHHAIDVEIDAERQWNIPAVLSLVRPLVMAGADISALDSKERRPVDMARERGHKVAVAYLEAMERGESLDTPTDDSPRR